MNISKSILLAMLCMALPLGLIAESERVISITDGNLGPLNRMLADGWIVKHQSASIAGAGDRMNKEFTTLMVFTLTPPSAELLAAAEARKKAEWQKRREEYLKSRQVEAP